MADFDFLTTVGVKFKTNVSGAELSSFKSGGRIPLVFYPEDEKGAVKLLSVLKNTRFPFKILGNGTNVLISDGGYDGVVVSTRLFSGAAAEGDTITAFSGTPMPSLSRLAAQNSLSGFEFLCGIPGSIGGGLFMNAGAYGGEVGERLVYADVLELDSGKTLRFLREDFKFGYRRSILSEGGYVVLKAVFRLTHGDSETILCAIEENRTKRRASQPSEPSIGSVFVRKDGVIPSLCIDKVGLKGYNIGGAAVSEKHAGFIVNKGGASSADYLKLVEHITSEVYREFGVSLCLEVETL
ncbi:MAG: UDP-N-acetylmuramate dehydrogenase [Clostridiales bacterium]|jgi:UDP-N-acetylmuramate dehydrogenase|nr:UDP-N-acetylmuramate dehydrogenase [Clostridiales bacterium]